MLYLHGNEQGKKMTGMVERPNSGREERERVGISNLSSK